MSDKYEYIGVPNRAPGPLDELVRGVRERMGYDAVLLVTVKADGSVDTTMEVGGPSRARALAMVKSLAKELREIADKLEAATAQGARAD